MPTRTLPAVDISAELLREWQKPAEAPDHTTLMAHLRRPLSEDEKIPISKSWFERLLMVNNNLTKTEALALFRITERVQAPRIRDDAMYLLAAPVPPVTGTEASFHVIWDTNISSLLLRVLNYGEAIRDSNHGTGSGLKRPDYGFLVNNYCLFRGEEKPPGSKEDPRTELSQTLETWKYAPLTYTLGNACPMSVINWLTDA